MTYHSNANMNLAAVKRDDEYYTRARDADYEIPFYASHLRNRTIYCNCDTSESAFVAHFEKHGHTYGIARLLVSASDFRERESVRMLEASDIVITNPPFTLFTHHLYQALSHNKHFLTIGNIAAVFYNGVWERFADGTIRQGHTKHGMLFHRPDGSLGRVASCFYTSLPVVKPRWTAPVSFADRDYQCFDNYPDVIECQSIRDIPNDYDGAMAVPLSYMAFHDGITYRLAGRIRDGRVRGREVFGRIVIQKADAPVQWKPAPTTERMV